MKQLLKDKLKKRQEEEAKAPKPQGKPDLKVAG